MDDLLPIVHDNAKIGTRGVCEIVNKKEISSTSAREIYSSLRVTSFSKAKTDASVGEGHTA